jgi:type IV secretion system protein VirB6
MGIFATFWNWLNAQLAAYVGDNAARLARALEPAIGALAVIYVMVWGYLQLGGKIREPITDGLRRIALLAAVLGVGLHLWLYDTVIVDTFYRAPAELAAAVVGSADPVGTIDAIWTSGGSVAGDLWSKGGVLNGDFGFYLAGAFVWCLIGMLCVYAMFLIALSAIALSVLLALGPLFVTLALFEASRRLFQAWIAQLATYGLTTIITVMVGALLLRLVQSYAAQTAARGAAIMTVDALDMVLVSALVFLVFRQVMPIASALAGGIAMSTYGAVSRVVAWGLRGGARVATPLAAASAGTVVATAQVAGTALRRRWNRE